MTNLQHTAAYWTGANPTLDKGQIGNETDTGLSKKGDGTTPWNSLMYYRVPFEYSPTTAAGTDYTIDYGASDILGPFDGLKLSIKITVGNAGAPSTLNFNGFGSADLLLSDGSDPTLEADAVYDVVWNTDHWQVLGDGTGASPATPNLQAVLTAGNDGGGLQIKNIANPTLAQDAATKAYADALVVGLWDDRGNYNPTATSTYPVSGGSGVAGAVLKGDIWTIAGLGVGVTWPIGTKTVQDGDNVRALVDTPGTVDANWAIGEGNLGYVPENITNKTDTVAGNTGSSTKYLSVKGYFDWLLNGLTQALSAKVTPVDADSILIEDSADSNKTKKTTWANIKATLKTYFDTLYGSKAESISVTIDGGGAVIGVNSVATWQADCNGTITGWEILETSATPVSSSIVIDIWKDTYANYPPVVGDTIINTGAGGVKPTLTTAIQAQSASVANWTTAFVAGDIIKFNVDSVTSAKKIRLKIIFTRS